DSSAKGCGALVCSRGKKCGTIGSRQVGCHPFFEHAQADADHRQDIDGPCENCHCPGQTVSSSDLSLHVQRLPFLGSLLRTSSVEIEMRPKKELVITARLRGLDATPAMAAHQRG